jgi:nicotinamidase-related amidase
VGDDDSETGPSAFDALAASGHRSEIHIYAKGGHGFGMTRQGTSSDDWIDDFYTMFESTTFAIGAMMQALLVVDAQNEFSAHGMRPVPNHGEALQRIQYHTAHARQAGNPIAWIQHFNRPDESRAFVPGSWGAELSPGLGVRESGSSERHFTKDVYGAFTATGLEAWLRELGVTRVLLMGFFTHMCVSTTAREALVRGFDVHIDPDATGARDLQHDLLGRQTADEVRRSALLQLENMGAVILTAPPEHPLGAAIVRGHHAPTALGGAGHEVCGEAR